MSASFLGQLPATVSSYICFAKPTWNARYIPPSRLFLSIHQSTILLSYYEEGTWTSGSSLQGTRPEPTMYYKVLLQRHYVAKKVLLHLCWWRRKWQKTFLNPPKFADLGVCQKDCLQVCVNQHTWYLNLCFNLRSKFSIYYDCQIFAEPKEKFLMLQQSRDWVGSHQPVI